MKARWPELPWKATAEVEEDEAAEEDRQLNHEEASAPNNKLDPLFSAGPAKPPGPAAPSPSLPFAAPAIMTSDLQVPADWQRTARRRSRESHSSGPVERSHLVGLLSQNTQLEPDEYDAPYPEHYEPSDSFAMVEEQMLGAITMLKQAQSKLPKSSGDSLATIAVDLEGEAVWASDVESVDTPVLPAAEQMIPFMELAEDQSDSDEDEPDTSAVPFTPAPAVALAKRNQHKPNFWTKHLPSLSSSGTKLATGLTSLLSHLKTGRLTAANRTLTRPRQP